MGKNACSLKYLLGIEHKVLAVQLGFEFLAGFGHVGLQQGSQKAG